MMAYGVPFAIAAGASMTPMSSVANLASLRAGRGAPGGSALVAKVPSISPIWRVLAVSLHWHSVVTMGSGHTQLIAQVITTMLLCSVQAMVCICSIYFHITLHKIYIIYKYT